MILREITQSDGSQHWALISQVEHARLSGEMAQHWGNRNVAAVIAPRERAIGALAAVRREVLSAITHHDDGWRRWEAVPEIDTTRGRPPSFLEMPLHESLVIWRDSVLAAERIGQLAAWMVAGHFSCLLQGSESSEEAAARKWLADMQRRSDAWFHRWAAEGGHTRQRAAEALDWLQLFDQFSLRLCCDMPTVDEPMAGDLPCQSMKLPGGGEIHLRPTAGDPVTIVAEPWPFGSDVLELKVAGHRVPVLHYNSTDELLGASRPHTLRWRLAKC